ncbi:hypothetical protein LJ754_13245 [Arthrobacter sp. zg-Y40]|uniref:hypothetical protein n=1 Tax=Arthrobacter sp. zg-Y40 TaxID=2886939 RepID=UPI001D13DEFF|nr:hypothetical protein [Arthrobacter sp. zg-Y40]
MNFLYSLPLAVTPAPDETLAPGVDPKDVTPGLLGFIFTLFMVIAIVFLIRDMTKRIRRVRYREQLATELLEREAAAGRGGRTAAPASSGQTPAEGSHPSDPDSSGKHLH